MKKQIILTALLTLVSIAGFGQKYNMTKGNIYFFSDAKLEDIEAYNRKFNSVIDASNGSIAILLNITDFTFENSLMQEHFNEKYMHSDKFPNSTFSGTIADFKNIDLSKNGKHEVSVSGKLSMHGITKEITVPATIEVKDGMLIADCQFKVAIADYGVERPKLVLENIAEIVDIHVSAAYSL